MSEIKKNGFIVEARACADLVGLDLVGENIKLNCVAQLEEIRANSLRFVNVFKDQYVQILNRMDYSLVIALPDYLGKLNMPHIISEDPKLHFCIIANKFFSPEKNSDKIEKTASLGENVSIGQNVYIGHNTVIEDNVIIGDDSIILHNVIISKNCKIGKGCLIKSSSVIGQRGFGFQRDFNNIPISFPHYGSVLIGDNVEIGASNTIASGSLENTVIADNVKSDDQVHIAHNVLVGEGTLITACTEISGSVKIGKNCWIGPNSAIKDGLTIGDNVFVGIGAVVTKSINNNAKVAGNPARLLAR